MSDPSVAASAAPFDMPGVGESFEKRGGWVVCRLVADAGMTQIAAAGLVGNLGGESGLRAVQEKAPISGRGGFGWAQWTGPRRVLFEHYCADHDLDQVSDAANYGFLVEELKGSQAHTVEQADKTTTIEAATFTVEAIFERPANLYSGLNARVTFAKRALAGAVGLHSIDDQPAPVPPHVVDPDNSADALNGAELAQLAGNAAAGKQTSDNAAPTPPAAAAVPAPSAPPPQLGAGHGMMLGTGLTGALSAALIYLTHWPLQPMTEQDAGAFATLALAAIGVWVHRRVTGSKGDAT